MPIILPSQCQILPVSESSLQNVTGPSLSANDLPLQRFALLNLRTKIGHSLGIWLEAEHLTRTRPRREERRTEKWLGTYTSDKYPNSYSEDRGQPALAPANGTVQLSDVTTAWHHPNFCLPSPWHLHRHPGISWLQMLAKFQKSPPAAQDLGTQLPEHQATQTWASHGVNPHFPSLLSATLCVMIRNQNSLQLKSGYHDTSKGNNDIKELIQCQALL